MDEIEKNNTKKNKSIITKKDILILKNLVENGRESSSSISKKIDLGREIVNYRIKRLIKENLIVKFIPKINEEALNYKEYIILIKLNLEDELSKEKFIKEKIGNKYLLYFVKSNSGWDLIVRLFASSVEEFKLKLNEILENFSSVLANYYTIISSDKIKEEEKRILTQKLFNENLSNDYKSIKNKPKEHISTSLDEKDKEILKFLETDARIQYKDIAEKLSISSDTVKYRIDKMKSMGVIKSFEPVINFTKLGLYEYASIIRFKFLNNEEEEKLLNYINKKEEIIKAIKNLNNEEFFLNLVFENETSILEFENEIKNIIPEKFESVEIFYFNK
jgi:Lrp/AsnC family leucine-responsive transcriptional regulator